MSGSEPRDGDGVVFDPDAVHAKYLAERDKRLVPGRAAIRDLSDDDHFARYRRDPFTPVIEREPVVEELDVVIVGGGIAGVATAAHLRKAGVERIRIVDQAGGIGGTWYWNRYPGVMCDVESYIYLPMLDELGYVPSQRYAFGEEIRQHLQAIAERFDLVADALFHTDVNRAAWDADASRWRVHTDRGDELRARWYVLAVGVLNLMKLPAIPGMEDFAGHSFHTARWDYDYTGGGPGQPLTKLADRSVALLGTGATAIQCLAPLAAAAKRVYVFQRTPSAVGVRGNRPTDPSFAAQLEPGWQRARMDNFQARMQGKPVNDLVDDGWTRHYAAVHHPPRWKGMTTEEYVRGAETLDYEIMEEHRQRVDALVAAARGGRDLEAVLPLPVQAPVLPRRVPAGVQRTQRHLDRLPGRHRAGVGTRTGRRRPPVRRRLHHLRDRFRGGDDATRPPGRPRRHRPGRHHAGGEVVRWRRQLVRDDEQRLPEPVLHAGPRPAGGGHPQLHATRGTGRRVHQRRHRAAP